MHHGSVQGGRVGDLGVVVGAEADVLVGGGALGLPSGGGVSLSLTAPLFSFCHLPLVWTTEGGCQSAETGSSSPHGGRRRGEDNLGVLPVVSRVLFDETKITELNQSCSPPEPTLTVFFSLSQAVLALKS